MKRTQKQPINVGKYSQPEAMVNAAWVAGVYLNGWGVPQDYGKAHKWLKKAAEEGNTTAMVNLGRLYERGLISNDQRCNGMKAPDHEQKLQLAC